MRSNPYLWRVLVSLILSTHQGGGRTLWITSPNPDPSGNLNHLDWTFPEPTNLESMTRGVRIHNWARQQFRSALISATWVLPFPCWIRILPQIPQGVCVHRPVGEKCRRGLCCLRGKTQNNEWAMERGSGFQGRLLELNRHMQHKTAVGAVLRGWERVEGRFSSEEARL